MKVEVKTKNKLKWYIFYDNTIKGYYVCKGGFRHDWYKDINETKGIRDKFNKEGV